MYYITLVVLATGREIAIMVDGISHFYKTSKGYTTIVLKRTQDNQIEVQESFDTVRGRIDDKRRQLLAHRYPRTEDDL